MTREERIIYAAYNVAKGCSLKDFMTDAEIEEAISLLADVLIATGVQFPDDECERGEKP